MHRDVWMRGERGWGSANALGVIADAVLLSHCEWLVGTHTSAVSKAAYLLMYARLGRRAQERAAWPDWPGSLVTPTYVFGKLEGPWAGHEAGTRRGHWARALGRGHWTGTLDGGLFASWATT